MSTLRIPETRRQIRPVRFIGVIAVVSLLILTACSSGGTTSSPAATGTVTDTSSVSFIATLPGAGLQVSLFATGTASYFAPDAVEVDNGHVFIDYQNNTAKDCTDQNTSTVVEYTMTGSVVKTYTVPGHSDGMRADPSTHLLWVTSCEDGNAKFVTIDPASGTVTPYTIPPAPHKGGYDDLFFINGAAFVAASAPALDANGNNTKPAIDKIALSGGKMVLTPILMGNATATNTATNKSVTLNLTDPDSMTVDPSGNLVLVDQADSQLILISNPGTPQQATKVVPVGSQLDDTVWATSSTGRLLLTDGTRNQTFWISGKLKSGTIYTELPDDSGVAGLFGQVDPGTGIVTPLAIGFQKPTGLLFVPNS